MSLISRGKLGQLAPADTNNHTLAQPQYPGQYYIVEEIVITNITGGALTYRIFLAEPAGYGSDNALYYDTSLAANVSVRLEGKWYVSVTEGIGVRASAAGLVFTAIGEIRTTDELKQ